MKCLTCGKDLVFTESGVGRNARKYCDRYCQPSFVRPKEKPLDCAFCGKALVHGKAGNPRRTCNQTCRDALAATKRKKKTMQFKSCDNCNKSFETTFSKQRFCSKECRHKTASEMAKLKSREYYAGLYPDGIKRKPCGWCGEILEVPAQKTLASRKYHESCSLEAQRARYRIKSTKRRTKMLPQRIAADQVVREYGDTCHICDEQIDLTLARTSKMGLTIDHVIPLSKGGSDEMDNLRPAHWICNNRKSDKIYG